MSRITNDRKISSRELDETFWFGKSKDSASNSRSVHISRLRFILKDIDGISVSHSGAYWSIDIADGSRCDYFAAISMLKELRTKKNVDPYELDAFLDIAMSGVPVPDISEEWLDPFKEEYSELVIEFFSRQLYLPGIRENRPLCMKIANVLLLNDPINETAISIKCKILYETGQKGASRQCYDNFVSEYLQMMDELPKLQYKDIIS